MSGNWRIKRHDGRWAVIKPDGSIRCVVDDPSFAVTIAQQNRSSRDEATPTIGCSDPAYPAPVYCVNTGEVYPSLSAAAKAAGVSPMTLKDHIFRGKPIGKIYYDYMAKPDDRQTKIRDATTGIVYNSIIDVVQTLGSSPQAVQRCLGGSAPKRGPLKGHKLERVD